jgi:EpsI family protein
MIRRRDLMMAGLAVGGVGAAEALKPRKRLVLLAPDTTLEKSVPSTFGAWEAEDTSGLVSPAMAGRLAKALYSETLSRNYYDANGEGRAVMLLIAYGDTQSDLLQLHRPESCYPAVGYALEMSRAYDMKLPGGGVLPVRRVVATTQERRENIVYWTRMGEALPRSGGEQREARLDNAIRGFVADGILVRASMLGDSEEAFATLDRFVLSMLTAVPRKRLPALIGTRLSQGLA